MLYEKLGINPTATAFEIQKAYHKLSILYHPDKHAANDGGIKDLANKYFQEIEVARSILLDAYQRICYDHSGMEGVKLYIENQSEINLEVYKPKAHETCQKFRANLIEKLEELQSRDLVSEQIDSLQTNKVRIGYNIMGHTIKHRNGLPFQFPKYRKNLSDINAQLRLNDYFLMQLKYGDRENETKFNIVGVASTKLGFSLEKLKARLWRSRRSPENQETAAQAEAQVSQANISFEANFFHPLQSSVTVNYKGNWVDQTYNVGLGEDRHPYLRANFVKNTGNTIVGCGAIGSPFERVFAPHG
jgi:hypothetical protein